MRKKTMLGVLAGALAVTAVGPSVASAAELSVGGNGRLTFTDNTKPATPGDPAFVPQVNDLTIGRASDPVKGDTVTVTDAVTPITLGNVGARCSYLTFDQKQVSCAAVVGTSIISSIDVNAGSGNDTVRNQTDLPSTIDGGNGDDVIVGGTGNDVIKPGGGRDSVDAGAGDDIINTSGYKAPTATTSGTKGDPDQLITCGPGNDTVTMDTRDGIMDVPSCETVTIEPVVAPPPGQPQQPPVIPTTPAVAQAPTGTAVPSRPAGTAAPARGACSALFIGTAGADRFVGNNGGDRMFGRAGNDLMNGFAGDDCLYGDSGRDRINGHGGKDIAVGGSGNDAVNGGSGNDKVYGKSGNDRLLGASGNDRIWGDAGKDTIIVGSGSNVVSAGSGNDTIRARNGRRDVIRCGSGRDRVRADRKDRLVGCERRG